jgi:hypothetical protein
VAELRQVAAQDNYFPSILFVFQGSVAQGKVYFDEHWPEARAIADPRRRLYADFGIQRGSVNQVFGVGAIRATARAARQGHLPSAPIGDPRLMPGMFLVNGRRIVWQHYFQHIGDHPDLRQIPAIAAGAALPV